MRRILTFDQHILEKAEAQEKKLSKAELLKHVKSDVERHLRLDGRAPNRVGFEGDGVSADYRNLGKWEHDKSAHTVDDAEWRTGDDHKVWAKGEHDKYKEKFKKFIEGRPWAKSAEFHVSTGEKCYAYFVIAIKMETPPPAPAAAAPTPGAPEPEAPEPAEAPET